MIPKKLYRSSTDRIIAGVCGGLAKYLDVDSTLIRVIFILLLFMGGSGILIYIVLLFVMPPEPTPATAQPTDAGEMASNAKQEKRHGLRVFFGLTLVFIGLVTLLKVLFPLYDIFPPFNVLWPIIIIALGLFIVIRK